MQIRLSGPPQAPVLIYLPGLHGDWTLIGSLKAALAERVRFVEITYPRTTTWTLGDYAAGVLSALQQAGIARGWLLAESFGSQVAWKIVDLTSSKAGESAFTAVGLILAGGFVKHPMPSIVRLAQRANRAVSMRGLTAFCRVYGLYAKFRHRRAPEAFVGVKDFIINRSDEQDRQAIACRYTLIQTNDLCQIARAAKIPVYQLAGLIDPIVPWFSVRRWLKRNCPAYAGSKVLWGADHNVLGTAPAAAARQILQWMDQNVHRAP